MKFIGKFFLTLLLLLLFALVVLYVLLQHSGARAGLALGERQNGMESVAEQNRT